MQAVDVPKRTAGRWSGNPMWTQQEDQRTLRNSASVSASTGASKVLLLSWEINKNSIKNINVAEMCHGPMDMVADVKYT